jgi:hypothetical protein
MAARGGAQTRPGWELEPDLDPVDEHVRRRRWRVLRAALPPGRGLDQLPVWIKTPDQFLDWLMSRLSPASVRGYFEDLEVIAKQTCDLEMLRFARQHKSQP